MKRLFYFNFIPYQITIKTKQILNMHQSNKNQEKTKIDSESYSEHSSSRLSSSNYTTPEKPLNMKPIQQPKKERKPKSKTNYS